MHSSIPVLEYTCTRVYLHSGGQLYSVHVLLIIPVTKPCSSPQLTSQKCLSYCVIAMQVQCEKHLSQFYCQHLFRAPFTGPLQLGFVRSSLFPLAFAFARRLRAQIFSSRLAFFPLTQPPLFSPAALFVGFRRPFFLNCTFVIQSRADATSTSARLFIAEGSLEFPQPFFPATSSRAATRIYHSLFCDC